MTEAVKISYLATTARVRAEFSRKLCLAQETPPPELIQRAQAKLEAVKAEGNISFYFLYDERLTAVWQALRAAIEDPLDRVVHVTLGAGAPHLAGLRIEPAGAADKAVITVASEVPRATAEEWRWEWFKLNVAEAMRSRGLQEKLNNAQLYSVFCRIQAEGKIAPVPIGSQALAAPANGKSFSVIGNKQRREIGVAIRNVRDLRETANRDAMLGLIQQAVKQLSVDGIEYKILKKDFLTALQSAMDGPEGVGVDIPLILLAATGQAKLPGFRDFPGSGRIRFAVSPDRMEATIQGFAMSYYDDPKAPVTLDWVKNELQRCRITLPLSEEVTKELSEAIAGQIDLNDLVACRGQPGQAGKGPYLHCSFKDAESRAKPTDLEAGQLNIRDMQQRSSVQAGQLVAEVRFQTPLVKGMTVFGEEYTPADSEALQIDVGEGIQARGKAKFYAVTDGIPVIGEKSISLTRTMVHEGDVNLRTGNIYFEGPVDIKGSIDSGASVNLTGDLSVEGSILAAQVSVQGNITAKSGIVTGPAGFVHCKRDINADFIENSNIVCHGNLTVSKAILNSTLYVGGTIKVTGQGGVIAGGRIFSRDTLTSGMVGTARGATTVLNIGVDWKAARSAEIKQKRLDKLTKRAQDDRLTLRDLVQKKPGQLTARHKELKEELQERLTRLRTISERLEALIHTITTQIAYSSTARILVRETLFTNVNVQLCGQVIAVQNELANVGILPKRRRGSFIVPLEEIEREMQEAAAADQAVSKARRAG